MKLTVVDRNKLIVRTPGPQGPQGAAGSGGGGSISDGDKGDITVSASGATWTIDANAVTTSKLQTISAQKLLGRSGGTTGDVEQIGLSADLEIDGSKNLALANALAQQSITLTAGTGLSGGGDLSASRSFSVDYGTTAGTACQGNDSRLSDARTPTSHNHAATEITSGTLAIARIPTGTTASDVCIGNDSRLSDSRTPTAHTHDFTDSYVGHIETPAVGTYYIDTYAATARTITGIHIVAGSGTVDYTFNKVSGLTSAIYTADGQGTTQANVTSGLSNTSIAAGDKLELVIDATSSGADFRFAVVYSRATGAIT